MVLKSLQHLDTEDLVIRKVAGELKISATLLNPYTDLIDDLYLDNIDRDLLIARLERDFNVVLSHEEVARIQTIRDASQFIQLHKAS
ncbi:MAG: hypothetical protein Sapg2KO_06260 [Saprospiraceae bacterium]